MFFCQNSFLKLAFLNRDSTVLHMFLKAAILKNQEKHPPTNNCSHCALCITYVLCIKWCVQGIMFSDRIRDERHTSQWFWSIYEGVLFQLNSSGILLRVSGYGNSAEGLNGSERICANGWVLENCYFLPNIQNLGIRFSAEVSHGNKKYLYFKEIPLWTLFSLIKNASYSNCCLRWTSLASNTYHTVQE